MTASLLSQSIAACRQAIAAEPDSALHHATLADILGHRGWMNAAASAWCRAHERDAAGVERWWQAHLPAPRAARTRPIFVVGCPHSGTTIMLRLLAQHPHLRAAAWHETHLLAAAPEDIEARLAEWDTGAPTRWVEKSVIHTFLLPRLLAYSPDAAIIIVERDGRDVYCSLKRRPHGEPARIWAGFNLAALPYWSHPSCLRVRHEDLVASPEETLRTICAHLGEPYCPEMLDYSRSPVSWSGVSGDEPVSEPHDAESFARHRAWQINRPLLAGTSRWRAEMTEAEKAHFKSFAQPMLTRLGYAADEAW